MMLDSVDEGPLVYSTVVRENGKTRPKKYSKLNKEQKLQDDFHVQATNIILHDYGLAVPTFQQGDDPIDYINKAMAFLFTVASREGHLAKQCTQPKWPRNSAWFKEKLMLVEAQEAGLILDEEQLAFIADRGIA
nr:retrovirus-related Pol polyprotein from transposon TNT 1-94 [Tanacetum cinerariifolium]